MCASYNPRMTPLERKSEKSKEGFHVDHTGPFKDKYFLIVVGSYAKKKYRLFPLWNVKRH